MIAVLLGLLASASPAPAADARIAALVRAVSAAELRRTDYRLVAFGTRNDFSTTVFTARDWIRGQFETIAAQSGGRMTVRLDTFLQPKTRRTPRAVVESSVIATLRGDPGAPTYVLSSHFDDCNSRCTDGAGVAPGADDNGSGTAAVLEAARVLASTPVHATIVFACFDGEELGLWGSDHYARELKKEGVNVAGDLNDDIIGAPNAPAGSADSHAVRVFSEALPVDAKIDDVNAAGSENDSPSRELARFVADTGSVYVPDMDTVLIDRADRFLRGGDQESFTAQGFPAVRFVERHEDFRHQHQDVRVAQGVQFGDLPSFVDADYLAQVTRMNVAALAALALGPGQPTDVRMPATHLTNDTTLQWRPARDAVRYEIVWRASTSPVWEHATGVGNVTEATVPLSKDDYIIGVRAVDASGLLSPVVTGL
ncbi:MAG TPA: M20/M25/M40 family metallo-hydrolase [Candidatus Baltobacteraceae bacterium]|nr:M20/M25/M40 family metallo-hydrolase [Candidatus Baltobacteraceae bacterium]